MNIDSYGTRDQNSDVIAPMSKGKITFEDVDTGPYGSTVVSNGYATLDWSNMYVINKDTSDISQYGRSGYIKGVTSGDQAAYTGLDAPASVYVADGSFTFTSVEMTSAWNKFEIVEISGYDKKGNSIFETEVTIGDKYAINIVLGWAGLSKITFTPLEGTHDHKLSGNGLNVVFDDMVITKIKGAPAIGLDQHSVFDHGGVASATGYADTLTLGHGHDLHPPTHLVLA